MKQNFRWNIRLILAKEGEKGEESNKILNKFICVSDFGNQRFKQKKGKVNLFRAETVFFIDLTFFVVPYSFLSSSEHFLQNKIRKNAIISKSKR